MRIRGNNLRHDPPGFEFGDIPFELFQAFFEILTLALVPEIPQDLRYGDDGQHDGSTL